MNSMTFAEGLILYAITYWMVVYALRSSWRIWRDRPMIMRDDDGRPQVYRRRGK